MSHPCEEEKRLYMEAMRKWEDATNYLQSFVSTDPLVPGQTKEPIPYKEYSKAIEEDKAAYQDYLEKMEAYYKCRKSSRE